METTEFRDYDSESSYTNLLEQSFRIEIRNYGDEGKNIKNVLNENIIQKARFFINSDVTTSFEKRILSSTIISDFIAEIVKKHFSDLSETKAFVADYQESSGSLIIVFKILAMTIINYGAIRDTMDRLSEDIEKSFDFFTADKNYQVRVQKGQLNRLNFQKFANAGMDNSKTYLMDELGALKKDIRLNRILIMAMGFIFILSLSILQSDFFKEKQDKTYEIMDQMIERRIRDLRFDNFLNLQYLPDSLRRRSNLITAP